MGSILSDLFGNDDDEVVTPPMQTNTQGSDALRQIKNKQAADLARRRFLMGILKKNQQKNTFNNSSGDSGRLTLGL